MATQPEQTSLPTDVRIGDHGSSIFNHRSTNRPTASLAGAIQGSRVANALPSSRGSVRSLTRAVRGVLPRRAPEAEPSVNARRGSTNVAGPTSPVSRGGIGGGPVSY